MRTIKICILLFVVLIFSQVLFTACGRGVNNNSTPPPNYNYNAPPPPPPPRRPDTFDHEEEYNAPPLSRDFGNVHPVTNFNGRTLTIGGLWPWILSGFIPGNETEPSPATHYDYILQRARWDNSRRVEQQFNISINERLAEEGDMLTALTTAAMAGEVFADIVLLNGTAMLSAAFQNLIVPIDTINLPNSDILGANIYGRISDYGFGHVWGINNSEMDIVGTAVGINLDILNAIGAPNPVELYESGRWTWEIMLDIMRSATRDTNGDGVNDQFGIAGQPESILLLFMGANDASLVTEDWQFYLDYPNTIEAMQFTENIFHEGLWESDGMENVPFGGIDVWGQHFWSYQNGNSVFFVSDGWTTLRHNELPFSTAIVPVPTGPSNLSGNTWTSGWVSGYAITANNPNWNPADVLMIIEEIFSWHGGDTYLTETRHTDWLRQQLITEEDVMRKLNLAQTMNVDPALNLPAFNIGFEGIFAVFAGYFISREMTPLQAVEAHRNSQQELIDEFFR